MTASEKLSSQKKLPLPCPFCGGTSGVVQPEHFGCFRYRCDCGASPAPVLKLAYLDGIGDPEADAIARWNERAGSILPSDMTPEISEAKWGAKIDDLIAASGRNELLDDDERSNPRQNREIDRIQTIRSELITALGRFAPDPAAGEKI